MATTPKVYEAIAQVTAAISGEGIAKDRKNAQQGYQFRGIDDVYNAISPLLAKYRLCIIPNVLSREVVERKSNSGGALFSVTVQVRFDLVSAEDGSKHEAVTYGEAMDSGDKATNKAMSAAYKYLAMQLFCIPTEGDNDADAHTHQVQPEAKTTPKQAAPVATEAQVQALEDFLLVDNLDQKLKDRINVLLAANKEGKLTKAKAAQALDALTTKPENK